MSPNSEIWSVSVGILEVPVLVKNLLIFAGMVVLLLLLNESFLSWVLVVPPEIATWHSSPSHNEPSERKISLNFLVDEPISNVSFDSGIILPFVWIIPTRPVPDVPPVPFSPAKMLISPPLVLLPVLTEPPFCASKLKLYPLASAAAVPAIISIPDALILSLMCNW